MWGLRGVLMMRRMREKYEVELVDAPKSGMFFKDERSVIAYYKRYAKQASFGVLTQRTKRELEGTIKYITVGCACGGKHKVDGLTCETTSNNKNRMQGQDQCSEY
ncbi:hypothetical protein CIPAW_06G071300 [Carya illinoinensis]|uniref:FAR1 domain-containing protein n=1 Tax=Carya illinoinensis TaxID=32201 RepID=A0A8T1Q8V5_CARIL|nr:hypothetical protein CIPAW_06G071300 [Carya illinoinensis]